MAYRKKDMFEKPSLGFGITRSAASQKSTRPRVSPSTPKAGPAAMGSHSLRRASTSGGVGSVALSAPQRGPGVTDPAAGGATQQALRAILGGVQRDTPEIPAGLSSEALAGLSRSGAFRDQVTNPLTGSMRVGAALEDVEAQAQAREQNYAMAQEALKGLKDFQAQGGADISGAVGEARGRGEGFVDTARAGVGAAFDDAQAAAGRTTEEARRVEQEGIAAGKAAGEAVMASLKDTTALLGQQLALGAKANFESQTKQLASLANQGLTNMTPQAFTMAREQLKQSYKGSLGNVMAQTGAAFAAKQTELTAQMGVFNVQLQQALGGQTVAAVGGEAAVAQRRAETIAGFEQMALNEQSAFENAMVNLEAKQEFLNLSEGSQMATRISSFMVGDWLQTVPIGYLGLLDSVFELMEDEVDEGTLRTSMSITGNGAGQRSQEAWSSASTRGQQAMRTRPVGSKRPAQPKKPAGDVLFQGNVGQIRA